MTIKGTIEHFDYISETGHNKVVLTVRPNHQQLTFIEFRGYAVSWMKNYKIDDEVEISVEMVGKTSKKTGIRYNNLVAREIKKVSHEPI